MQRETMTRAVIAARVYAMTTTVLFGAGVIFVLSVSGVRAHAALGILAVALASLLFAAPAAWMLAPRLRARLWRRGTARYYAARLIHAART
ncbi:MAG: hypothetical protein P8Y53_01235 [Pseudolabrys sp.]